MIKDGLIFYDESDKIIFNQYSFCEYVKWNIAKYADLTYAEADDIVSKSHLVKQVGTADDVYFLTHEIPYHWAMLLVYGAMYWTKGIPYPAPCSHGEYEKWMKEISTQFNLKEVLCEFPK
jgi:hypothetical protein